LNYLILSRAKNNFGDFLIFQRGLELMKHHKKDCNFVTGDASIALDEQFSTAELADIDAVVIPGGPGLRKDAYPKIYPLSKTLFEKQTPVFFLGAGSKIYPYSKAKEKVSYNNTTKYFLGYLNNFAPIGVRDFVTKRILEKHNYKSTVNGCPAWYCLENIGKKFDVAGDIENIVFSVPAGEQFVISFLSIVKYFRHKHPEIKCSISFNHGITVSHMYRYIYEIIKKFGCEAIDMSGSLTNTRFYDESTLHIGYRVHTHVYYLSMGKPSFLIAEDSRGVGVLEALNTPGFTEQLTLPLKGYGKIKRLMKAIHNPYIEFYCNNLLHRIPNISDKVYEKVMSEHENGFPGFSKVSTDIKYYYENQLKPYIKNMP